MYIKSHYCFGMVVLSEGLYLGEKAVEWLQVESQFKNRVGRHSRGVKQGPFWVLWSTAMPSVLIETGFLSNEKEEQYLLSTQGQDYIASGIYRAFKEYKAEVEAVK